MLTCFFLLHFPQEEQELMPRTPVVDEGMYPYLIQETAIFLSQLTSTAGIQDVGTRLSLIHRPTYSVSLFRQQIEQSGYFTVIVRQNMENSLEWENFKRVQLVRNTGGEQSTSVIYAKNDVNIHNKKVSLPFQTNIKFRSELSSETDTTRTSESYVK